MFYLHLFTKLYNNKFCVSTFESISTHYDVTNILVTGIPFGFSSELDCGFSHSQLISGDNITQSNNITLHAGGQ